MKEEEGLPTYIGIGIVLVLLLALALAVYPGLPTVGTWLGNSDAAAWVQAVGSIGAIVAAIWVANRHSNQQRLDRVLQDANRLAERFAPAITLATEAHEELKELAQLRKQPLRTATGERYKVASRAEERQRTRAQRILQEVTRLDPLAMPSVDSILAVREVVNAVQDAERELQEMSNRPWILSLQEAIAEAEFGKALQRVRDAKAALQTELDKLSRTE
ncbi:hypothetical protein [Ramlibacter sp. Leaf400]|uniref:hypothetical protein n=1 Tax=Ramlibacter sp. Leaf400 TaxID=1736365 RepID=UPI0012E33504|nr:hypothetical protein [Ramlibacter sp. Leaf400]